MSNENTIRALLTNAGELPEYNAARIAWVRETMAKLREAQRHMDDRCTEAVDRLSEEDFNRLFEEEQAKVDAIRAPIDAVVEHDRWPRELYFGGI